MERRKFPLQKEGAEQEGAENTDKQCKEKKESRGEKKKAWKTTASSSAAAAAGIVTGDSSAAADADAADMVQGGRIAVAIAEWDIGSPGKRARRKRRYDTLAEYLLTSDSEAEVIVGPGSPGKPGWKP